jgi:septal ring factor EnvC (AmiA/AmiB activator)
MNNPNPFDDALNIVISSSPVGPNPAAVAAYHAAPSEFDEAPTDELATLRADNDARGALIERLRADLACSATELDTVCSERDALLAEMNEAYEACTKMARQKDELHRAVDLANARADRQAARAELAEAETARQQRLVALFVRVLREMTPGEV